MVTAIGNEPADDWKPLRTGSANDEDSRSIVILHYCVPS